MKEAKLLELIGIKEFEDLSLLSALELENLIGEKLLQFGKVEKQIWVSDRGDGRRGKIDVVFHYMGESIPIEIDRKLPRAKSIFKVLSYNKSNAFVITRDPFRVVKVNNP